MMIKYAIATKPDIYALTSAVRAELASSTCSTPSTSAGSRPPSAGGRGLQEGQGRSSRTGRPQGRDAMRERQGLRLSIGIAGQRTRYHGIS
jgi:hypothetical protein